jgi:tRNA(Ile)-lysidine synthetase-like protein
VASPAPRKIFDTVRGFARHHGLFHPGPLVLAVSGGTDSTALALIAAQLRDEFGLVLHVAHFDHRARPRAAAQDAAFVSELANHISAPIRFGRAEAKPRNEDDARRARYAFLRRVAREIGATAIATGHTKDDQAETVLLHLTRGAGIDGLAGMRPDRDGIVRPLLAITRADTTAVVRSARITAREDPTNRSLRFARNRVRHRVLPQLALLNPDVVDAIARLADAAAATADLVRADADDALEGAVEDDRVVLDRLPLDSGAKQRALAQWWEQRTGRRLAARHRAALVALSADTRGSKSLDLPGARALREYGYLSIATPEAPGGSDGAIALRRGATADWHGWHFALDRPTASPGGEIARFSAEVADQIVIRSRRPGDRLGGRNRSKVQDVFTDAKVPSRLRDTWPLVAAGSDVLWVPGLTAAPHDGDVALEALRIVEDRTEVTADNRERVASLSQGRQSGGKRGSRRT